MGLEAGAWLIVGRRFLYGGVVAGLVGAAGCGSGPDVVALTDSEQALTYIALAYGEAFAKLGRGPKDADELKPFLKQFGDPERLLVSPSDGQPYVIVWGANPTRGGPTEYRQMFPILAYEKQGSGGKRAITDIRGRPMTIPAKDLGELTFAAGHRPAVN